MGGETVQSSSRHFLMTKVDNNGNLIWEKIYDGPNSTTMYFRDFIQRSNGNLVLYVHIYNMSAI